MSGYDIADRGKRVWGVNFSRLVGEHVPVITCPGRAKATYIREPADVLIDDFKGHIRRWVKAGGKGIWYQNAPQAIAEFEAYIETITQA
jgi:hypothetical protein